MMVHRELQKVLLIVLAAGLAACGGTTGPDAAPMASDNFQIYGLDAA